MRRSPRISRPLVAACLLAAGTLASITTTAHAQVGTAITYQGLLERNGVKVNTASDLRFTLFDAASGGAAVGNVVTLNAQQVTNGLFNVSLDFGVNPYTADAARWMQIEVRNPAGAGSFVPMGARQKLTPSPFSLATRGINVNAGGNVGIGTDAPFPGYGSNGTWQGLDINNPNAGGAGLAYLRGDAVSRLVLQARNNIADFRQFRFQNFANKMQFGWMGDSLNDPTPAIAIDTNSNVGIGTTTTAPNTRVHMEQPFVLNGFSTNLLLRQPIASWGLGPEFANYRYIQTQAAAPDIDGRFKQFNVGPGGVSIGYPNTPGYGSEHAMYINGNVGIGTTTPVAKIDIAGNAQANSLELRWIGSFPFIDFSSDNGDFGARIQYGADDALTVTGTSKFSVNVLEIRGGSDLVEGFDSVAAEIEPGTLMVIDPAHPGQLMPSTSAYDSKVAGIVSGANGVNPGIKMGQDGVMDGKNPIAMTGRVYVKATTTNGAIKPGDLLTTSDVAGHAMKASEAGKSQGTVVGKAMSALDKDTGLVLVLVNLQ